MIKRLLLMLTLLISLTAMAPATTSSAFDPFKDVNCKSDQAKQSAICNTTVKKDANGNPVDPLTGSNGLLAKITNIVALVAGVAAVIIIIIGSIRFITSGGDSGNVKKAKDTVFYALIGLAVIVLARTLILFVLSKLN